jgi:alcohol dehydrogenase class IV
MKTPAWRGFHEHCQHRAPRILRIGGGASRQLPDVLATLGLSRPLIVTDAFLVGQGRVETLQGSLKAAGIASRVFDGTVPDPTVASIEAGLAFLREGDHDCVVGFGGAARSTARRPSPCSRATAEPWPTTRPHVQDEPGLPVIAIPTTAGTGSEATRVTVITDEATDEKMMCPGLAYLPVAALVDYELTFTKPRRLTADTGIDSLTTRSRPMSRSAPARSPMAWRCWRCARSRPTCAAPATIPMTAQRARR